MIVKLPRMFSIRITAMPQRDCFAWLSSIFKFVLLPQRAMLFNWQGHPPKTGHGIRTTQRVVSPTCPPDSVSGCALISLLLRINIQKEEKYIAGIVLLWSVLFLLQIRMPNGVLRREKFFSGTKLQDVLAFICKQNGLITSDYKLLQVLCCLKKFAIKRSYCILVAYCLTRLAGSIGPSSNVMQLWHV